MAVLHGDRRNNTIVGTAKDDLILVGGGDDTVDGGAGDDLILAGRGDDSVSGGDGDDLILAGRGDDIIHGGAGDDRVLAGRGDDTVIHVEADNVGTEDYNHGGRGQDMLRLVVSRSTFDEATFQAELAQYQAPIAQDGAASGCFSSLGVRFRSFEKIEIVTDNSVPNNTATNPGAVGEGDTGTTDVVTVNIADQVTISDPDSNDTQVPDAGGLALQSVSGPAPAGGLEGLFALDTTTGTIRYDRAQFDYLGTGETVTATFRFDAASGPDTIPQTIVLTIIGENDAPTAAQIDLEAIDEDGTRNVTAAEPLDGATDVDGPTLAITELTIQSGGGLLADHGNGTWTYAPAAADDTQVTLTYTASDGDLSASSTASLDLTPGNNAPVAADTFVGRHTDEDTPLAFDMAPVVAASSDDSGPLDVANVTVTGIRVPETAYDLEDFDLVFDADADTFSFDPTGLARFGGMLFNPDDSTAPPGAAALQALGVGETATVTVTYDIADAEGLTDSGTVSFPVEGQNDAPVAADADGRLRTPGL